jgi:hypothetical protein
MLFYFLVYTDGDLRTFTLLFYVVLFLGWLKKGLQYYVYNYQGKRVRTVTESNQQVQSQRGYLPSLDLFSTNQEYGVWVVDNQYG